MNQTLIRCAAEQRTIDYAKEYGSVKVRVEPIYDATPQTLNDGTPIPEAFRRLVTGPDGKLLEDASYLNK